MISLFFKHDLDEVVAARPAAGNSYRNPVERFHSIANIGLQSVGMMRAKQDADFERLMNICDGNADVRKECERNATFKKEFWKSVLELRELLQNVLRTLSMKGVPFSILLPGTEENENNLKKEVGVIDERFSSMNTLPESKQSS